MLILSIATLVAGVVAVALQLKRDLMMLQQNSYRNDRYNHWISESGESTRYNRLLGICVFLCSLVPVVPMVAALPVACLYFVCSIVMRARAKYKKPLVFTHRAIRIYSVAAVLAVGIGVAAYFGIGGDVALRLGNAAIFMALAYSGSICLIEVANILLAPVEKFINRRYYNEAAQMLRSMPDLRVIGITGSYGKTSTKHYLNAILSEHFDVLMTPGNFNTTLGVIRTVREHMKPYNQVFIVEMGAKQLNDIKEICDLVHPTIGIITAVGPQHLESFKSIENVQRTKFELADALPADGLVVVNNDFEYISNRPVNNAECVRYTAEDQADADYRAVDIAYSPQGTDFTIEHHGKPVITLHTKLVGRCNVSNLVAAVIVALRLGVPAEKIRYAVERIQQVEHRLSIKHIPGGINIIDDAYNSNPVGSQMALEVLAGMTGGKRIVITPGMIELGADQYDLNMELGRNVARSADVAIIVGEYNRDAIMEGINEVIASDPQAIGKDNVHVVDTFNDAQQLMLSLSLPGDTVLYENDLPDTFK